MENRFNLALCAMTISLALVAQGQAVAAPEIRSLKNSGERQSLSEEEIRNAEPEPLVKFSNEEIESMRKRFRELNPDTLDLLPQLLDPEDVLEGVPEKIDQPDAKTPYWSSGKLLFKKANGVTSRCTGQFVEDLRVILTAAHCVMDYQTGEWRSNFMFLRAAHGEETAQRVGWRCISVYKPFFAGSANLAYDYAFILTDVDSGRAQLPMVTGSPSTRAITSIGYPRNYGAGKQLYKVDGQWEGVSGGIVTMSGNPMGKGSSGGAWFTNFQEGGDTGKNQVISVNSHVGAGDAMVNGPLFTGDTVTLSQYVKNAGCMN